MRLSTALFFLLILLIHGPAIAQDEYCKECSYNAWEGDSLALENFMESCGVIDTISYDSLDNVVGERPIYQEITMKLNNGEVMFQDKIFIVPHKMPEYKGGFEDLIKDVTDHLQYPAEARDRKISGTVYVQIVIDEKGKIERTRIMRGLPGGCSKEAIRVVNLLDNWSPGMCDDKTVKVQMVLPIKFALN